MPFTKIDGISVGGWQKKDAIRLVDESYAKSSVSVFLGGSKKAYRTSQIKDMGITVTNKDRINSFSYPWYLRIMPASSLWGHYLVGNNLGPTYSRNKKIMSEFIDKNFDESGVIKALNATLDYKDKKLSVVPSQTGGDYTIESVRKIFYGIKPRPGNNRVVIKSDEIEPKISDEMAKKFGDDLVKKVGSGVDIMVNNEIVKISADDILSWIDFDDDGEKIIYNLSSVKAADYIEKLIAPKVAVAAGKTTVTTYDFSEVSRVIGNDGQGLNFIDTLDSIKLSIEDKNNIAKAVTMVVAPTVVYKRDYSSTDSGISALLKQYAESNKGVSSVSFVGISGSHRRAEYNSNEALVSASTYKLFVAYSALARVEDKKWKWTDEILSDGRNLAVCLNDMIVKSDNPCAEAIAKKAGWKNVTDEARAIGCSNTSLTGTDGYARTSSADLALFLAQLETGQILKEQASRDLLISAMKKNIYRKGIPAGVNWEVADKVGFINGVLNDASIVYAPNGTYVLVIMTDGSSWATIADLANKIETLQAK